MNLNVVNITLEWVFVMSTSFKWPDIQVKSHDEQLKDLFSMPSYHGDEVLCLHPVIIVNPSLPALLHKYRNIVINGEERILSCTELIYHYGYSVSTRGVTYDNYTDSYIVDKLTGETFPVYLLVPCGHCECCQKAKLDAIAHRCVLETMAYDSLPWFITLTYANDYLPKDGVCLDHVQRFLKRLRIHLAREGYGEYIRYFCASEYSPVGRPHYHIIFWNIHPKKFFRYYRLFELVQMCWPYGFIYNELVSPKSRASSGKSIGSPQKCFEYVSKYINKDCDVPEGKNPTFHTSSNRGGGIGAPFLDKYVIPKIRKTLKPDFLFLNHLGSGNIQRIYFNRYVLNRCFPTFSSSCPLKLRNAYRRLLLNESILGNYRHGEFLAVFYTLSKYLPSPMLDGELVRRGEPPCFSSCWSLRFQFDQDIKLLQDVIPKVDFEECLDLDRKRKLFVSRLLEHREHRDLQNIAYKFRISRARTKEMVYLPM